jgi:hypothetical protein
MALPNYYISSGEQAIATYDFLDLAARVGYKTFYGAIASGATTVSYVLTANTMDSYPPLFSGAITGTASQWNTEKDLDFDVTFSNPQIIQGDLIINSTSDMAGSAGGTANKSQIIYTAYHVNTSGTETTLGTVTTNANSVPGIGWISQRDLVKIPIAQTKFKNGEKLRVNLLLQTYYETAISTKQWALYFDPSNRGDSIGYDRYYNAKQNTDLKILIPFKIDL